MAKLAKKAVNYRHANWWEKFAEARTCGDCAMFRPRLNGQVGLCTLVAGDIRAGDVCDRWAAK